VSAQLTVYSKIGDEMARRTSEESGDFVVDRFLTSTRSPFQYTSPFVFTPCSMMATKFTSRLGRTK